MSKKSNFSSPYFFKVLKDFVFSVPESKDEKFLEKKKLAIRVLDRLEQGQVNGWIGGEGELVPCEIPHPTILPPNTLSFCEIPHPTILPPGELAPCEIPHPTILPPGS